jgi:hypothetical protein
MHLIDLRSLRVLGICGIRFIELKPYYNLVCLIGRICWLLLLLLRFISDTERHCCNDMSY